MTMLQCINWKNDVSGYKHVGTEGTHLLVEYWGCDVAILDDVGAVGEALQRAAEAAGAVVVGSVVRPFSPQGVTGVLVLEESHLSVHTWPESGYAAVDLFTCGDCRPERAHVVLREAFKAMRSEMIRVARGRENAETSMQVEGRIVERQHPGSAPTLVLDEVGEDGLSITRGKGPSLLH